MFFPPRLHANDPPNKQHVSVVLFQSQGCTGCKRAHAVGKGGTIQDSEKDHLVVPRQGWMLDGMDSPIDDIML